MLIIWIISLVAISAVAIHGLKNAEDKYSVVGITAIWIVMSAMVTYLALF